jgi:uncharacterized protein YdiU (UPF0061 family)
MKEKLMELFKGLDSKLLTEDFQDKVETLFETAVEAAVASKKEELKEQVIEETRKELSEFKEMMIEKNAQYADTVAKTYLDEKCDNIEVEMKKKLYETIVTAIVDVFKNNGINLPETATDLAESYKNEVAEVKEQLNDLVEENIALRESVLVEMGKRVWQEKTFDLPVDKQDELKTLMEDFDFEDEKTLSDKIDIMKKSFLNESKKDDKKQSLNEHVEDENEPLTARYLNKIR